MTPSPVQHIESNPQVCGGRPYIAGTRIRVQDVCVWHHVQGLSPDEIVSRDPQLTLAGIYSALAYYWDHRDEIAKQMREETAAVESLNRPSPAPHAEKEASLQTASEPTAEIQEPAPPPVVLSPVASIRLPPESVGQTPIPPPPPTELMPPTPTEAPTPRPMPLRLLNATPSWLVSMAGHLLLLLLLTFWTLTPRQESQGVFIVSSSIDEIPMTFEAVTLTKLDDLPEVNARSVAGDDLQTAAVGDAAQLTATATAVDSGDLQTSAIGELGDVFGSQGQGLATVASGPMGAEFFGVKAKGRRFVFIVDSSNSMRGGKFIDAKRELLYAIQKLAKDQYFYVMFFDHDSARMTFAPKTEPEPAPVAATRENIAKFEKWMNSVQNELRTDPYDSVKFAVEMMPDAIYILSDGRFTDRGRTLRYLQANNLLDNPIFGKGPKVVVHTVGFHGRDGEETLQSIAKSYGGSYRFVPGPLGEKDKKAMKMAKK